MWICICECFYYKKKYNIYRCNFMCFPSLADKAINHFNNLLEANTHFAKVFAPHSLFTQSKTWYIEWLSCCFFFSSLNWKSKYTYFYVNFIWYSVTSIFLMQEKTMELGHKLFPHRKSFENFRVYWNCWWKILRVATIELILQMFS